MAEIQPGPWVTRNGTQAYVAEAYTDTAGRHLWRGTVQGGGITEWDLDGTEAYGEQVWDLVEYDPAGHA